MDKTLALEPRHFGALSGLGLINMARERDDDAVKAFEAALKVHPHLTGPRANIETIKRAVEMKLGVALLPARCAITEMASGRLVGVPVVGVSRRRQVMLVCRTASRSHAANAFLAVAQESAKVAREHEG